MYFFLALAFTDEIFVTNIVYVYSTYAYNMTDIYKYRWRL